MTGSIPVSKYLLKLMVDTVSGDSIVFVTLNNPHLPYLTRSFTLCKDLCQELGWGDELRKREGGGEAGVHSVLRHQAFQEEGALAARGGRREDITGFGSDFCQQLLLVYANT